jgi:phage shock protein A
MLGLMQRIDSLLSARAHYAVDQAEDPLVNLAQLMRDLNETRRLARNEVVLAVAAERRLASERTSTRQRLAICEKRALEMLEGDHDGDAERLALKVVDLRQAVDELDSAWQDANQRAASLRERLMHLGRKREHCARQRQILLARQRSARAGQAIARSGSRGVSLASFTERLDAVADAVADAEALADAETSISEMEGESCIALGGDAERRLQAQRVCPQQRREGFLLAAKTAWFWRQTSTPGSTRATVKICLEMK